MYKEFIQVCRQRHSIRSFNSQPVEEVQIRQILEAVQTVPTAGNLQAFEVVLVKDSDQIAALARTTTFQQMWITEASAVMVFVALPAIFRENLQRTRGKALRPARCYNRLCGCTIGHHCPGAGHDLDWRFQ